jgi:uncharacterized membrane protein YgdD (TMEM256/DUF423 family)
LLNRTFANGFWPVYDGQMRIWLFIAAVNGGLAVLCGAFAAHGLSGRLSPDALGIFETGARYHMYHALAIGLAALLADAQTTGGPGARRARAAAALFLVGIVLFCGSLYLLALTGARVLGFVTPFGGLAFVAGWLFLGLAALRPAR